MKSMRFPASILSVICLTAGFSPSFSQLSTSAGKVTVGTISEADKMHAGSSGRFAIVLTTVDGWHINSHHPAEEFLISTNFDAEPQEGIIVSDIRYPAGTLRKLSFAEKPLDVYEGKTIIFLSVRFSANLPAGVDTIRGGIRLQACNDQVCLAPSTIPVRIPVQIVPQTEQTSAVNAPFFSGYNGERSESTAGNSELASLFENKGAFLAYLAVILIGLALNLTPCVYPMLSVTVSLFGAQSDTSIVRVLAKAVLYVLGICTMYSVLGVSASLGGGLFGGWLQSPLVLGGIGALLFGLALSSFGLYQIQIPYWITSRVGGTTGTGLVGIFLSGLVVGIFAAPCVGPPVLALLALVAAKGDPFFGFRVFFALSFGLGLPYLILGTFSGLVKRIPRSGAWMVWVERIFGVILSGAALFYLTLAVAPKYVPYVIPLVLIAGGVYLGFIDSSGRGRKALRRLQWAFGVVSVVFGIVIGNGLRAPGLDWEPFSEQGLAAAKESRQPAVLDFYADWCIPCLELDRNTFTNASVTLAMKDVRRFKVDLTHLESPEVDAIRHRFNISGVPTLVFIDRQGDEPSDSRLVGFVPPEEFLRTLASVVGKP